jgi:hypothetical protein
MGVSVEVNMKLWEEWLRKECLLLRQTRRPRLHLWLVDSMYNLTAGVQSNDVPQQ